MCGNGEGLARAGHCVSSLFGTGFSRVGASQDGMLGAVRVAQGWEREQSFGQVLQDGIEARLGWGFVALGRKMGFGWAHPAPGGMGNLPFAPLLCQGPKMGRRGVKSGERGRQGEAKPKRWEVTI